MIEEHPDVTKAKEMVQPVLDAIDAAARPELEHLQRLIERAEARGDVRGLRDYQDRLLLIVADVQRSREMALQPVIAIMNLFPTPIRLPLDAISPPLDSGRG